MGLGDGKLALGIGWLLGLPEAVSAVMLAFWIGAAVSLTLIGFQRMWKSTAAKKVKQFIIKLGQHDSNGKENNSTGQKNTWDSRGVPEKPDQNLTMKTAVPFGPFLICGLLIVYITGLTLL
jgi:prepilin signal peptidase PulO-like enzyme (type II secretory pathway)